MYVLHNKKQCFKEIDKDSRKEHREARMSIGLGYYILDSSHNLVFEYLPSGESPSFDHLSKKIKSNYSELLEHKGGVTAHADGYKVGTNLKLYVYFSVTNRLYYWSLIEFKQHHDMTAKKDDEGKGEVKTRVNGGENNDGMVQKYLLEKIDTIILEYFDKDTITTTKIMNNYDRISLIFHNCVNGGLPNVDYLTYENRFKDIIPMRTDFSSVFNSTAYNLQQVVTQQHLGGGGGSSSFNGRHDNNFNTTIRRGVDDDMIVPWRNGNIKNAKNELYIDMKEDIHVNFRNQIKNRKGRTYDNNNSNGIRVNNPSCMKLMNGYITGVIDVRSYLNGNPIVEMKLNTCGNDMGTPSLHPCVELEGDMNGDDDKVMDSLKFIPPDGKFCLARYCVDLNKNNKNAVGVNNRDIGLVNVTFENGLGPQRDEFEVRLNIKGSTMVEHIEDLKLKLKFVLNHSAMSCEEDSSTKIKVLRTSHGRISVVSGSMGGDEEEEEEERDNDDNGDGNNYGCRTDRWEWIFDKETATGSLPVLRGCIEYSKEYTGNVNGGSDSNIGSAIGNNRVDFELATVSMTYSYLGQLASGCRVIALDLVKSNVARVFKGVKYITRATEYTVETC
ncbi:Apm3p NDAI_0K01930 [Naumovozyma dairenensis CBS 421]|uniref:MHD domain-containing protein n=1 Tax=Naumovozyma dairenensis (strain ATCC 10597 / BCRC 20456 / CBS 421 / NBRC 0211 / NRRL Y-12639) TaxID=1071378 RepID=G0WHX3_NAUDC|nr:hypothetical protein NDAI_0K01930 [Naumovozyma dairenensis CBS 421]CCD27384.1 hypothetical protein NDAI_0K01930 [Naumovozyma dairenensis CBS 421]